MKRRFYHRTAHARAILSGGFRAQSDSESFASSILTGVWLSDYPLDGNEGCKGEELLEVVLDLEDEQLAQYEIQEFGKPYREWCLPETLVNLGEVRQLTEQQEEMLEFVTPLYHRNDTCCVFMEPEDGPAAPPLHIPGKWYWFPFHRRDELEYDKTNPPWWTAHDSRESAESAALKFLGE